MSQRGPLGGSSANTCSPGQLLVLIGSDGKRATVSRAVATEASYVLRDLLDGVEGAPGSTAPPTAMRNPSSTIPEDLQGRHKGAGASTQGDRLDDLFLVDGHENQSSESESSTTRGAHPSTAAAANQAAITSQGKDKVDIMDALFSEPSVTPTSAAVSPSVDAPFHQGPSLLDSLLNNEKNPAHTASANAAAVGEDRTELPPLRSSPGKADAVAAHTTSRGASAGPVHAPTSSFPAATAPPIELSFPYFTGDILQMACRHMTYRFRISTFGAEDGCFRVFSVKTREIPRPMVLPLTEYLDAQDRKFVQGWDELTTVLMVKCATLLNYEELLTLASAKLATFMMERSVEGMRSLLGVDGDFALQEETELKKEHQSEGWK